MQRRRVLVCGHRAFAARGIGALLERAGYEVNTFSRGPLEATNSGATGPVCELHRNPHLAGAFDAVINYVFLQNESIDDNRAYIDSLLQFCRDHGVKQLVHISSCSVYPNQARHIDDSLPAETDPSTKGPYGAVKVATEDFIVRHRPAGTHVALVRPGIILGLQMGGFMGGIAVRLPTNALIGLGHANSQMPVIARDQMDRAIVRLLSVPAATEVETILLAAPNSPTRREYIQACCDLLGAGTRAFWLPTPLWLAAAAAGEALLPLIGRRGTRVYSKVRSVCRYQRYSVARTEQRLGESLETDWRAALASSFSGTAPNYDIPDVAENAGSPRSVSFLGFGRIVKQRHLPALQRLGFSGPIDAFDIADRVESGVQVKDVARCRHRAAALHVVATPGPLHIDAAERLSGVDGRILVEKPLAYTREDFSRWLSLDESRDEGVYCCHSSRFRRNVLEMLAHLRRYNAGRLLHAHVEFQSPPVAWDPAVWLRAERRTATLLLDYGIHLLDIGAMFGRGVPDLRHCRYQLNGKGETELIEGSAVFDNYTLTFILRQGLFARKGSVRFTWQNYSGHLGFSPDVFVPTMSDDNFGRAMGEARRQIAETARKAVAAVTRRDTDRSHDHVLAALATPGGAASLRVAHLKPVYDLLFAIKDSVYAAG